MPGTYIRPEGSPVWVFFGVVAALTFTLLGWHNWYIDCIQRLNFPLNTPYFNLISPGTCCPHPPRRP